MAFKPFAAQATCYAGFNDAKELRPQSRLTALHEQSPGPIF
jgi:hypothetical protein